MCCISKSLSRNRQLLQLLHLRRSSVQVAGGIASPLKPPPGRNLCVYWLSFSQNRFWSAVATTSGVGRLADPSRARTFRTGFSNFLCVRD